LASCFSPVELPDCENHLVKFRNLDEMPVAAIKALFDTDLKAPAEVLLGVENT
jgi:hypothetical protein